MKNILKIYFAFVFVLFIMQFSTIKLYPWFKHYGGTQRDYGVSIRQTSNGGYIVAGHTESYTYGSADFAIYKIEQKLTYPSNNRD